MKEYLPTLKEIVKISIVVIAFLAIPQIADLVVTPVKKFFVKE